MLRTRLAIPLMVALAVAAYVPLFYVSYTFTHSGADGLLINDVSRLNPTRVDKVVEGRESDGIQDAVAAARAAGLHVAIAGRRHSMGGHAFYEDAVVLDMTTFDRVHAVDAAGRTVTVESGATWKDVIEALNPHGLAVGVMQAYNGFTVGGSLSVNVHESDPNFGPLVETVDSFRLLLANGTILHVSRDENAELFGLVIGGYGLFGVILDVTLNATPDEVYRKSEVVIPHEEYPAFFREAFATKDLGQVFARLSIATDETFLREMVVTTYERTDIKDPTLHELAESKVALKKFVFGLSRTFDWGKDFRWYLQREQSDLVDAPVITRNNLMNGDVSFLDYRSSRRADILQEYFVPVETLPTFIDELREVSLANDLNLLSATIRYIPVNRETVLTYSATESFGVVLYFNVGSSTRDQDVVQAWTRELIDAALSKGGTYYLPYVPYASKEQFRAAYPDAALFFAKKDEYDPDGLFRNRFYDDYATS